MSEGLRGTPQWMSMDGSGKRTLTKNEKLNDGNEGTERKSETLVKKSFNVGLFKKRDFRNRVTDRNYKLTSR